MQQEPADEQCEETEGENVDETGSKVEREGVQQSTDDVTDHHRRKKHDRCSQVVDCYYVYLQFVTPDHCSICYFQFVTDLYLDTVWLIALVGQLKCCFCEILLASNV